MNESKVTLHSRPKNTTGAWDAIANFDTRADAMKWALANIDYNRFNTITSKYTPEFNTPYIRP